MKREHVMYPEMDIRKDKTARINIYLCFKKDGTLAVKASSIDEVREKFAELPAFHVTELVEGQVFHYLAGMTKIGGKELLLTRHEIITENGTRRIMHEIGIASDFCPGYVALTSQRRMPREYLKQLDGWETV